MCMCNKSRTYWRWSAEKPLCAVFSLSTWEEHGPQWFPLMAKGASWEVTGNIWSIMQSAYFQILSPCQIHSAQRMGLREWNLAQCAFLSFSLHIYILWRTPVAQWTEYWKGNRISGYSHIPASGNQRIAEVMRHLWKSSCPLCPHTVSATVNHILWSSVVVCRTFLEGTPYSACLPKAGQAVVLKAKTEHLVAQLAQAQVSSLSWSLHRNNLVSKCGLCGLHSKWSIDMLVEYSIHRFAGKKNPRSYLLLSVHVYGFSPNICPQSQSAGYTENLCMLYI